MSNFFMSDEMRRNPYPVYEKMRKKSPLLHVQLSDIWVIFDYEGAKQALQDHNGFGSKASDILPDWLLFLDPPRHTKLRALITRAFSASVIASIESRVRELSRTLLDRVIDRGEMELTEDFSGALPSQVIAGLIGIPAGARHRLKAWSDAIVNLTYVSSRGDDSARALEEYARVKEEMGRCLDDLMEQRLRDRKDNLLSLLVDAEVDGERLTRDEILNFFALLLSAGIETTTSLINNAVLCFMENPGQFARLKAVPHMMPSAVEEVLRYRSPAHVVFRFTKREVEIHSQKIPAGKTVFVNIGSANRDPKQFREPDRFDIARDPNPHLSFGQGIHYCVGAMLSRLEARIALEELIQRFRNIRLASDQPWEPRKALHTHGPSHLQIRFEPVTGLAAAPLVHAPLIPKESRLQCPVKH